MNRFLVLFFVSLIVLFSGCSTRGSRAYTHYNYMPKSYSADKSNYNSHVDKKYYSHPTMRPYVVRGKRYHPTIVSVGDRFRGYASWYGPDFDGKATSNGETYNMYGMTAAHKTLPMNTIVRVTNRNNGKSAVVRVNDRGPFVGTRIIDLSKAAASKIDMIGTGTAPVTLEVLGFYSKNKKKYKQKIPPKKELDSTPEQKTLDSFALQIASFSKIEGAIKVQEKYDNTDGYRTVIKDITRDNTRLFKVYLKGFKSEQEARDYKSESNFKHAFIVREDS